ncbi:Golgi apyrase [Agyrium rufum]|nr:Golgi apyrase [Agyrium rufum]
MAKWQYGVILDAGSSGTRAHVYRWLKAAKAREEADEKDLKSLPEIKTKKHWTKKLHPGVSSFADSIDLVGPDHLKELFDHALNIVPEDEVSNTPIFLLATAGVRLLPEIKKKALLEQVCSYARSTTNFLLPDCGVHIQVIPGETEGLYGWIAANYLLGGFDDPEKHNHGKGHHTYGFLDMGGASAQIAFAPNATEAKRHADDLKLLRMRTLDGAASEHQVFVTTWLGFGVHEARKRYVNVLLASIGLSTEKLVPDPCLPHGLKLTTKGDILYPGWKTPTGEGAMLVGTGKFDECLRATYPLLEKNVPCSQEPCLLHGVHVPAIDFDVNHFVGVSEYWHTTHEVFEMAHKDKAYDFNTYQSRVKEFCTTDWKAIEAGVRNKDYGEKVDEATAAEVCFKASWLINVLHDGIGIPRVGLETTHGNGHNGTKEVLDSAKSKGFTDSFQAVDKIDDTEVSWTLGKMVLYASSQIPPSTSKTLPVGFGSNVHGFIPNDFQYAAGKLITPPNNNNPPSSSANLTHGHEPPPESEPSWSDNFFDSSSSPRRIPGFLLFMVIICIAVYFLNRRSRIFRRFVPGFLSRSNGSRDRGYYTPTRRKPGQSAMSSLGGMFGAKRGSNSEAQERLLEGGNINAPDDFELDDMLSSPEEPEHSDSSSSGAGSSSVNKNGRTSGWATPRINTPRTDGDYFSHSASGSVDSSSGGIGLGLGVTNAMDRSGLFPRTESRDKLFDGSSSLSMGRSAKGRRSRRGSPNRHSNRSMASLLED